MMKAFFIFAGVFIYSALLILLGIVASGTKNPYFLIWVFLLSGGILFLLACGAAIQKGERE